ncbi:MAG: hypothetical protein DRP03_02260 [Candidatus Aenigmatarchaeota archaeon]|nr:MAG: hypothetical protein DRP03_02260 [Candidatus Aenigmarchaeota archaeon]
MSINDFYFFTPTGKYLRTLLAINFLFDELLAQKPEVLEDIINYYLKVVCSKEGKKYIFLDEIQKVPYWQDIVKRFYDTREDIKFFVSGSASLQIKNSKESLAGRIFDFYVPVLSFKEFLEMNNIDIKRPEMEFSSLKKIYEEVVHKVTMFENMLNKYILRGFPEIAREENEEFVREYVKSSIIEKIIFEDIPSVFETRRRDVLYSILEYACKNTSNMIDISGLAKTLNVNYHTAKLYIFYLQRSFLLDILFNYSGSFAKQLRKNKKVHIAHPSIAFALLNYNESVLDIEEVVSKFIESVVFQHVRIKNKNVYFWRTPNKDEVDIVLAENGIIPIEVKYKSEIAKRDIKGMIKFMKRFKIERGFVITKDVMREEDIDNLKIFYIPAWLFLTCF